MLFASIACEMSSPCKRLGRRLVYIRLGTWHNESSTFELGQCFANDENIATIFKALFTMMFFELYIYSEKYLSSQAGLEPTTFWSPVRRSDQYLRPS